MTIKTDSYPQLDKAKKGKTNYDVAAQISRITNKLLARTVKAGGTQSGTNGTRDFLANAQKGNMATFPSITSPLLPGNRTAINKNPDDPDNNVRLTKAVTIGLDDGSRVYQKEVVTVGMDGVRGTYTQSTADAGQLMPHENFSLKLPQQDIVAASARALAELRAASSRATDQKH